MLWNVPISLRMGQFLQHIVNNAESDLKETDCVERIMVVQYMALYKSYQHGNKSMSSVTNFLTT